MSVHVAILMRPYLEMILDGSKTIESRLTMRPLPPYRAIAAGERIYFKASAGPFMGTAVADKVEFHEDLTVPRLRELYRKHNHAIRGNRQFWNWKKNSLYATLIHLAHVEPSDVGPKLAPSRGLAWFVLPDDADPRPRPRPRHRDAKRGADRDADGNGDFDFTLTPGAIRNRYVRVPAHVAGALTLLLPGGEHVDTVVTPRRLIRWRGWGPLYDRHDAKGGDVVRFVSDGSGTYRVTIQPCDTPPSTSTSRRRRSTS